MGDNIAAQWNNLAMILNAKPGRGENQQDAERRIWMKYWQKEDLKKAFHLDTGNRGQPWSNPLKGNTHFSIFIFVLMFWLQSMRYQVMFGYVKSLPIGALKMCTLASMI